MFIRKENRISFTISQTDVEIPLNGSTAIESFFSYSPAYAEHKTKKFLSCYDYLT